jgi:hypothetical protein
VTRHCLPEDHPISSRTPEQAAIVITTPAPATTAAPHPEILMTRHRPTRRERIDLATAALRGVLTGATHALLSRLLEHLAS